MCLIKLNHTLEKINDYLGCHDCLKGGFYMLLYQVTLYMKHMQMKKKHIGWMNSVTYEEFNTLFKDKLDKPNQ